MIHRLNGHAPQPAVTVRMTFTLMTRIFLAAGIILPPWMPGTRLQQNRHGLLIGCAGEVDASLWLRSIAFVDNPQLQDMTLAHVLRPRTDR